jgi:uncharacterized protein YjiS (DUF1127 family)
MYTPIRKKTMATLQLDQHPGANAQHNNPIYETVRHLINILKTWEDRAKKRRELRILLLADDSIFKDINAQRLDISQEAFKPFWRD